MCQNFVETGRRGLKRRTSLRQYVIQRNVVKTGRRVSKRRSTRRRITDFWHKNDDGKCCNFVARQIRPAASARPLYGQIDRQKKAQIPTTVKADSPMWMRSQRERKKAQIPTTVKADSTMWMRSQIERKKAQIPTTVKADSTIWTRSQKER